MGCGRAGIPDWPRRPFFATRPRHRSEPRDGGARIGNPDSPRIPDSPAAFLESWRRVSSRRISISRTIPWGVHLFNDIKTESEPACRHDPSTFLLGAKLFHYKFYGGLTVFKDARLRLGDFMAGQASNFRKPICRCRFILHRTPPRCLCRPSQLISLDQYRCVIARIKAGANEDRYFGRWPATRCPGAFLARDKGRSYSQDRTPLGLSTSAP
jgi:hypothetical protein